MKSTSLLTALFLLLHFFSFGQRASENKLNLKYAVYGVEKVTEYYYSYGGYAKCDSTPRLIQFYNQKGQLINERFPRTRYKNEYFFTYNDEGFLINIDSFGLFGFGSGFGRFVDTSYQDIQERWICFDTTRRLVETIRTSSENDFEDSQKFAYDDFGYLCSISYFHSEGGINELVSWTYKDYDSNGFLLKTTNYEANGKISSIHEFGYEYSTDDD